MNTTRNKMIASAFVVISGIIFVTSLHSFLGNRNEIIGQEASVSNAGSISISIASPSNGATVSGDVTVNASVSGVNSGAGYVQFTLDGVNAGSKINYPPYTAIWHTTNVSDGIHTLSAVLSDQSGRTKTASPVAVYVSNYVAPPTPIVISPPVSYVPQSTNTNSSSAVVNAGATCSKVSGATSGLPVSYSGIYVLGPGGGGLTNINAADETYTEGWSMRNDWRHLDTGTKAPNYQFQNIDDAVATLQKVGKKLALTIDAGGVPDYVVNASQGEKWNIDSTSYVGLTVAPWDPNAMVQYTAFMNTLSNHLVCDQSTGNMVAFKSHPALASLRIGIVGAGRLRQSEISDVFSLKTYNRTSFLAAVTNTLNVAKSSFPNTTIWVSYFNLDDGIKSPTLDSVTTSAIAPLHVGFFQELLRGDSPSSLGTMGKNLLSGEFVAFQACGAWVNHKPCTFAQGDDSPVNGFSLGYGTYGARYYELYVGDIQTSSYENDLKIWNDYIKSPTTKPSPQTLSVSKSGSDVNLSWDDINQLEDGYVVERSSNINGPWTTLTTTKANVKTYSDKNSPSGTNYYKVHGFNESGNLVFSNVVSTSGGGGGGDTEPPVISSVTAKSITSTSATISWNTNEVADSQVEYGKTTSYGNTTSLDSRLITSHLVALNSLTPRTTYHYRVTSKDASGNLAKSNDFTFRTSSKVGGIETDCSSAIPSGSELYGVASDGACLTWTVYTPSGNGPWPAVLIIHGGGFKSNSGGPEMIQAAKDLQAKGYLVFQTQYRLAPPGKEINQTSLGQYPDQTDDIKMAVLAARNDSRSNGKVGAVGGSAGGSHVAFVASEGTPNQNKIDVGVSLSGAYDFSDSISLQDSSFYDNSVNYVGSSNSFSLYSASPISKLNSGVSPLYMIESQGDSMPTNQLTVMLARLNALKVKNFEYGIVSGSGHSWSNWNTQLQNGTLVKDNAMAFLDTYLKGSSPSPTDTTPPKITTVTASGLTSNSAIITWTTDENSTSQVEYGKTSSYGLLSSFDSIQLKSHSVSLSGLSPNTTYNYRVKSIDASGNLGISENFSFKTPASSVRSYTLSVNKSGTGAGPVTSSVAGISCGITCEAEFTSGTKITLTARSAQSSSFSGWSGVSGCNSAGPCSVTVDSDLSITALYDTLGGSDLDGPIIDAVSTGNITASTALISWTTDEPSTSEVDYGLTSSYGNNSTKDNALLYAHVMVLNGLNPDTTYHFRVRSTDASGNITNSADYKFTTSSNVSGGDGGSSGGGGNSGKGSGGGGSSSGGSSSNGEGSNPQPVTNYGCNPGDLFSAINGQRCSTNVSIAISGCLPGYIFSSTTGERCVGANVQSNYVFLRDLSFGSQGNDVTALQDLLIREGYLSPGLNIGIFGSRTTAALIAYQRAHGISPASGYFGSLTRSFINTGIPSISVQPSIISPSITTTNPTVTSRYYFTIPTNPGETNKDIIPLQSFLVAHGFLNAGTYTPGLYDNPTVQALGQFQISVGLFTSPYEDGYGLVGPLTRSKLNSY